jgi:hypothetical protein
MRGNLCHKGNKKMHAEMGVPQVAIEMAWQSFSVRASLFMEAGAGVLRARWHAGETRGVAGLC